MLRKCKEYFKELRNEENERARRTDEGQLLIQEVQRICKEVRADMKRMKRGKAVGPGNIPVYSRCGAVKERGQWTF